MSQYKPYPAYKDSGVEWLGRVPEHWEITPLKYEAEFVNGAAFKPEQWSEIGTPIIRIENLNGGLNFNCFDGEMDARYHVEQGDLLFGWSGNRGTSFGPFIWPHAGRHYLNQHIFRICNFKFDKSWFYWSLKAVTAHVEDQAHGIIGMVHITKGDLGAIKLATPALTEQQAISSHLNCETARIDALIEKKTRFIELLREKRQALITHAVTKGLDPKVKMKDSGVEWLGEVPEHWMIRPFKVCIDFQEGPGVMAADFCNEGVPLLRVAGVQGRWASLEGCNYLEAAKVERQWSHFRLERGDLLISASASMGTVCEVTNETVGAVAYTGLIRLRGKQDLMLRSYIRYLLASSVFSTQIEFFKAGSTIQHFGPMHLSQMFVVCPPLEEQEAISQLLEAEILRIDDLLAKSEHSITLLKERRSALITAAVTGQIDLREAV